MGRVVQSPKIQISIASATSWSSPSPRSSRFPKDSGVEVANWGCCWNWLTSSQTGDQPTDPNFPVFQENFCQYLHSSETGFLFLTLEKFHQLLSS